MAHLNLDLHLPRILRLGTLTALTASPVHIVHQNHPHSPTLALPHNVTTPPYLARRQALHLVLSPFISVLGGKPTATKTCHVARGESGLDAFPSRGPEQRKRQRQHLPDPTLSAALSIGYCRLAGRQADRQRARPRAVRHREPKVDGRAA
ncbi:hypothetical protein B0T21DRAFT_349329 [Apiosordaria backusii]|uniref:Uncharacterized protein n=1 Tax=Apiosordaria backusii TaxID=314023 RepID=A0AA40BKJ1_9PEZI|nr:hypothetical protein B0T21DRAFT_349329 [Apiosordaria backusii]